MLLYHLVQRILVPEAERGVDGGAGVGAVVIDRKDGLGPERVRVESVR